MAKHFLANLIVYNYLIFYYSETQGIKSSVSDEVSARLSAFQKIVFPTDVNAGAEEVHYLAKIDCSQLVPIYALPRACETWDVIHVVVSNSKIAVCHLDTYD